VTGLAPLTGSGTFVFTWPMRRAEVASAATVADAILRASM
jgi:hypothetical protein